MVSWKSIIEDPSGTLPPIIKKWLAPAGTIVDLTTVISVPNDPNPIADYLQAVYDAREARDNAIAARIVAETEGATMPIWEADEIYSWWPEAPSVADVEADFDALWAVGAQDGDTEADRLADVEAALAELADLITGGDI